MPVAQYRLSSVPFARPTLAMVIGIAVALNLENVPISIPVAVSLILLSVLCAAASLWPMDGPKRQGLVGVSLLIAFFLLGFINGFISQKPKCANFAFEDVSKKYRMKVMVSDGIVSKSNSWRTSAEVISVFDSAGNASRQVGNVLLYWPKNRNVTAPALKYGDELFVHGFVYPIPGAAFPEDFNYRAVMKYRNTQHQMFLNSGSWANTGNSGNALFKMAFWIQETIAYRINQLFQPRVAGLLQSLLVGQRNNLDADDIKSFSATGTMHVLAVSGLHTGIIYLLLVFVFTRKIRDAKLKKWQGLSVILLLWVFALITGLSASVVRAALMFSILELGRSVIHRPGSGVNTLFAAAFLQLLLTPLSLFQVGFQLSYLAVLGIMLFYPVLRNLYMPPGKLLQMLYQSALLSITATIGTLPVTLYFFHSFPVYFILANILIVPLTSAVIFAAVGSLLLQWLPILSSVLVWFASISAGAMFSIVDTVAVFPMAVVQTHALDGIMAVGWLIGVVILGVHLKQNQGGMLTVSAILIFLVSAYYCGKTWRNQGLEKLYICNLRNQNMFVYKHRNNAWVFTGPVSKSKADSLLVFMKNWRQKNAIANLYWEPIVSRQTTCHGNVKLASYDWGILLKNQKSGMTYANVLVPEKWVDTENKHIQVFVNQNTGSKMLGSLNHKSEKIQSFKQLL